MRLVSGSSSTRILFPLYGKSLKQVSSFSTQFTRKEKWMADENHFQLQLRMLQPVFISGQVITWKQIQPVRRVTRFMKTSQLGKWSNLFSALTNKLKSQFQVEFFTLNESVVLKWLMMKWKNNDKKKKKISCNIIIHGPEEPIEIKNMLKISWYWKLRKFLQGQHWKKDRYWPQKFSLEISCMRKKYLET